MAINDEKILQAFNSFENGDFSGAKDIIKQEVISAKNDFLKTKLTLKENPLTVKEEGPKEEE